MHVSCCTFVLLLAYQDLAQKIKVPFSRIFSSFLQFWGFEGDFKTRAKPRYAANSGSNAFRGGKKRGVENLTNDTPPKKGFWTPPRTVRFPPPSGVSALFFLYKNPRQGRPETLLEGSKNYRESAFSGTFSSPHTFCTPPYHGPSFLGVKFPGPFLAGNCSEKPILWCWFKGGQWGFPQKMEWKSQRITDANRHYFGANRRFSAVHRR